MPTLEKLAEKRFFDKLSPEIEKNTDYSITFKPSEKMEDSFIIDKMLVKGVKFNREENDSNVDYMYVDSQENKGLRFYLHKYFVGYHPYYLTKIQKDNLDKKEDAPLDDLKKQ